MNVLWQAWEQVKSNAGGMGVDKVRIKDLQENGMIKDVIQDLHLKLKTETYDFMPVKRVEIPKSNGGTRPLGIPTVQDRIVQTAMKIILEPIFECDFHDNSYGYRPKRSAQMGVDRIKDDLYKGAWGVIEIDLKSYFTSIPHGKLMKKISDRIVDKKLLRLINKTLKVPVSIDGHLEATKKGVPQGSPLSPLYSNIYLNEVDHNWNNLPAKDRENSSLHRYADDMVIICRGNENKLMKLFKHLIKDLDLEVNEEKTKVTSLWKGFNFIGFEFRKFKSYKTQKSLLLIRPSKKSVANIKSEIRSRTSRRAPIKPNEFIKKMNQIVRGWANYFRYVNAATTFRKLQQFLNNRVRRYLAYRKKQFGGGFTNFPNELIYKLGLIQIHSGWVKTDPRI